MGCYPLIGGDGDDANEANTKVDALTEGKGKCAEVPTRRLRRRTHRRRRAVVGEVCDLSADPVVDCAAA